MNRQEFVAQMAAGVPCEIPRALLFRWLGHLETLCHHAECKVICDHTSAQVTPVNVVLKAEGSLV